MEHQGKILIIDDTPENLQIIGNAISVYKRIVATSGAKGIELAREHQPDLILLDIVMPEMDGYEVCEILKNTEETKDISVIFQTSNNAPMDEQKAFELGASDYITKPFEPEVVKSRIKRVVHVIEEKKKLQLQLNSLSKASAVPKTELELEKLIALGETSTTEFKSTLRQNLHTGKNEARIENQCLKTIVGFLNSNGGTLLVGVDDDGLPLGLQADGFKNHDKLLLHWFNLLKKTIGADLITHIESVVLPYKGHDILAVVCQAANRPVFFSRDDEEHFYIRAGNSTQSLKPSEMLAYIDNHFGSKR